MGGVESFSYYLAKSLGSKGHNTFSINLGNVNPADERYLDSISISSLNEKSKIISRSTFSDMFSDISPNDLLIIPMYARPFLEELHQLVKKYKVSPIVFGYLHGMGTYYYDNFKEFEPLISKFISVSQLGCLELKTIFPKRIEDISFLACPSAINLNESDDKLVFSEDKLNITFIGRTEDSIKGVFRLPQIINELQKKNINVKFRIVGNGPDHQELVERIDKLNLRTIEVEYILDAKTPELVKKSLLKSDILLLLSNYEGAPLVIYEALSCGVIPLSYDVGNVASTIQHGKSGMVYSIGEISKVATDILQLNSNKNELLEMSKNALNRITELGYNYDSYIKHLNNLYIESKKINPKKAIELVDRNTKLKHSNLNRWIKDIIPPGIIHKYYISHYLQNIKKAPQLKIEGVNENQLLDSMKIELKELKEKYSELNEFHDSVYTKMPYLWLKLGSLLRKLNL